MLDREILFDSLDALSSLTGCPQIKFCTPTFSILSRRGMETDSPYCQWIRSTAEGNRQCNRCDAEALRACQAERRPMCYTCHAGLSELIYPVFHNGAYVGAFFLGQFHSSLDHLRAQFEAIVPHLHALGLDPEAGRQYFMLRPHFPPEKVEHIGKLMQLIAQYCIRSEIIRLDPDPVIDRITAYVDAHLSERIVLDDISKNLHLNATYLSTLFHERRGITLSHFIQQQRIRTACFLLKSTDIPLGQICEQIGFENQNYFSKVFRRIMGMTPSEYRRRNLYTFDTWEQT